MAQLEWEEMMGLQSPIAFIVADFNPCFVLGFLHRLFLGRGQPWLSQWSPLPRHGLVHQQGRDFGSGPEA